MGGYSVPEQKLRLLAEHLPQRMAKEYKLSHSKQKQFTETIAKILDETKNAKEVLASLDLDETFTGFLHGAGGSELQLGVIGLCQICYGVKRLQLYASIL